MSLIFSIYVLQTDLTQFFSRFEYTHITIYFRESEIFSSQRSEVYGSTDFLASCGGLLGLCLGISVLSLLEIVYYCTIHLLFNRTKFTDSVPQQFLHKVSNRNRRCCLQMVKSLAADYSARSTIQGINYIADSNRSKIERLWWTAVFFVSVCCCGSLISSIYKRFDEFPVIVTFSEQETPISQIPFPAVTICPISVTVTDGEYITKMYHLFKDQDRIIYEFEPEQ
jgi:Amiloride-sensitive sodium channel